MDDERACCRKHGEGIMVEEKINLDAVFMQD